VGDIVDLELPSGMQQYINAIVNTGTRNDDEPN